MKKNYVTLGELATYVNGYAFKPTDWSDEGLEIIRIQNLTGNFSEVNRYSGEYNNKYEVNNGDVLISWSASLGVYVWNKGRAILNQHIFKVVFNKLDVDKEFFIQQVGYILERANIHAHGATMKHLTRPVFDSLKFYLPSREEQKDISNTLCIVDRLIELHEKQVSDFEQLVKSRFIEMFENKRFDILPWNEVFDTKTGKLDSNAMVTNGKYPFFTCSKEVLRIDNYAFDQEALLLAGNNAAGKYDVKYYNGKFNAYQRTYVLSLKNRWSYQLFKYQLENKLMYLQQQSLGGLTKYLTIKILGDLEFIVPPIELQNQFAHFVEQVNKSKLEVQKSLEELETLKKSLMQQYFG